MRKKIADLFSKIEILNVRKLLLLLFTTALILQFIVAFLLKFDQKKVQHDIYYLSFAKNYIETGVAFVDWEKDIYKCNSEFLIQKGKYFNWRPIGYSLFLYPILVINSENHLIHSMYQILFYSFVPLLMFASSFRFFRVEGNAYPKSFALVSSFLFLINPSFLIAGLQYNDTWFISFAVLLYFYAVMRLIENSKSAYFYIPLSTIIVFFVRPLALIPVILTIFYLLYKRGKQDYKRVVYLFLPLIIDIGLWGIRNYYYFKVINLTSSNLGYNLFLDNNEHTFDFLISRFGDGTEIERALIPKFSDEFSIYQVQNEFIKDRYLFSKGLSFIFENPLEFALTSTIKSFGMLSPLRIREGETYSSFLKVFIAFLFSAPIIIMYFLSLIKYTKVSKSDSLRVFVFMFPFLWILPYIFFFPTPRFRQPIDFVFIIVAVEYILWKIISPNE